jgi:hypothetical protein
MSKRVKSESVFINHLGIPVYTTEDEMKENYIKQVLVPWFIITKRYGIPKDLVKMITGMLKGYHVCPIYKTIVQYLCPPKVGYGYEKIWQRWNILVKNGEHMYDLYEKHTEQIVFRSVWHSSEKRIIYGKGNRDVNIWFKKCNDIAVYSEVIDLE